MLDSFFQWENDFLLACENGRGYIAIDDLLQFHIDRAEKVGHELTYDPRALQDNISHLLRNYPTLVGCVDTVFNDETLTIDISLGDNIADETELEERFNRAWGGVATVLNSLDPGSFGSGYLFDMPDMTAPKWGVELADCDFCGNPVDYCNSDHDWMEEN